MNSEETNLAYLPDHYPASLSGAGDRMCPAPSNVVSEKKLTTVPFPAVNFA
jgi:hypothetical protein